MEIVAISKIIRTLMNRHVDRERAGIAISYHEKSHVFIHLALMHFAFVHGFPYARGLKYAKVAMATIARTAAI